MKSSVLLLCLIAMASASSYTAEETHIFLWTSIVLGVVLLSSIYMLSYMDNGRDSILYAKIVLDSESRH
jgi:hypothetical protein